MVPTVPDPSPSTLVARLRQAGCVFAEDEARVLVETAAGRPSPQAALEAMTARRVAGEPLEQVVGWAEVAGVRVRLDPGVFVPRQRTALAVELALAHLEPGSTAVVVDLGCGSGALAAAVLAARPGCEVHAADVDPVAVACARRNLPPARVHEGDLYDALPPGLRGRVAVLLANGPYVPSAEVERMPPEARDHEHRVALDGGPDGLDVQRRVLAGAPAWLAPGGLLVVECGEPQRAASLALVAAAGLVAQAVADDDRGALVVTGRRAAGAA